VVIFGAQGSGKTQFGKLAGYARGHFVEIGQGDLISKYNAHWADALFVVANEVLMGDAKNLDSQRLKAWITDETTGVEEKFTAIRYVKNTRAWWLTSNMTVPVTVERGDRRYTLVETTLAPADLERRMKAVFGEWEEKGLHLWPELQAFRHHLLHLPVDLSQAVRPFETQARREALEVSRTAPEEFSDEAQDRGLMALVNELLLEDEGDKRPLPFSDDWWSVADVYRVFQAYCEAAGRPPLARNRLSKELKRLGWEHRKGAKGARLIRPPVSDAEIAESVDALDPAAPTKPGRAGVWAELFAQARAEA
jgi:hypothetical protein